MGIFTRPDSPYWWLWLETAPAGQQRERTDVRVGTTNAERRDNRQLAEAVYAQRMREIATRVHRLPTEPERIRFDKYADVYARDVIAHHKGKTRELELLKNLRLAFGEELLHTIDRARVQSYMTMRRANDVGARTVNREVDLLKAMLRDAVPKYLEASPIARMKRLRPAPVKRRLLAPAEEKKLLRACEDAQDRAILILGLDTLVRLGDLLDVTRDDRRGVWLTITDPKNGELHEVPLSPRAATALDRIRHDSRYYFAKFRRAENPRDWPGSVRQRLEYLCRKVNIPYGRSRGGITFHWATRRTGATRLLVNKRVPIPVVKQLGHWKTSKVLLDIYTEAQTRDLLRAVGQKPLPHHSRSRRKAG